jgi:hypothetical protein
VVRVVILLAIPLVLLWHSVPHRIVSQGGVLGDTTLSPCGHLPAAEEVEKWELEVESKRGKGREDAVKASWLSGGVAHWRARKASLAVVEVASRLPVDRQGRSVVRKWGAQVNEKSAGVVPRSRRSVEQNEDVDRGMCRVGVE